MLRWPLASGALKQASVMLYITNRIHTFCAMIKKCHGEDSFLPLLSASTSPSKIRPCLVASNAGWGLLTCRTLAALLRTSMRGSVRQSIREPRNSGRYATMSRSGTLASTCTQPACLGPGVIARLARLTWCRGSASQLVGRSGWLTHPHPVQQEHALLGRGDLERSLELADEVVHVEVLVGCHNVLQAPCSSSAIFGSGRKN